MIDTDGLEDTVERPGFRMVQRIEGTRADLGALTADAERLYWRLMLACDAHGCHRAEPLTVAGTAMVGVAKVTVRKVEKALSELLVARIIDVWIADDGAHWLEIVGFDERQSENVIQNRPARTAPPRPDDGDGAPVALPTDKPKPDADALDPMTSDAVQRVFDHWAAGEKRTGGVSRAMLTPERRKRIRARLKDGYTVEELCMAIDGFHADPFHLGKNNRDSRYTDLHTILKSAAKVDAGIAKSGRRSPGGPQRRTSLVNPQSKVPPGE